MFSTKVTVSLDDSQKTKTCPKSLSATTTSQIDNEQPNKLSKTLQTTRLDSPKLSENGISASEVVSIFKRIPTSVSHCAKFQVIKSSLLRPSVFAAALSANGSRRPILPSPIASSLSSATAGLLATVLSSSKKHQFYGLTKSEDGEPLKLPESLESLPKSDHFPSQRHRWNTNEEIASMLIAFDRHQDWLSKEVKIRPKSGSMLLYSRKKVRYRRDGYCWKKRKDGKTTREDHMKLKVQGMECIYGCYVHSAILPTFHRRCYWLLQNPDIVLVHYLNVPYPDDNKMVIASSISLWGDKKEWTKEELISQLKPMFFSEEEPDLNNELEISTAETVEAIVVQLMEKQRAARTAALNKQLECGCPDSLAGPDRTCPHHGPSPIPNNRRVRATKSEAHTTTAGGGGRHRVKRMLPYLHENNNQFYKSNDRYYPQGSSCPQVSSTTGNQLGMMTPERDNSETPTPQPHQFNFSKMGHHHPSPLLLSLSQLQPGGGLLIVNSGGRNNNNNGGHSPVTTSMNGLTPLILGNEPSVRLLHSSGRSDTMDSSASSSSPVDLGGAASTSSPVSSAVRSLASLSDFSLDLNNGNFDSYSGVQPVTDTMLSGHEKGDAHGSKLNGEMHHVVHHGVHHGHHGHRGPIGAGPLLDFRSAFSDFEGKTGDLGFFDLNNHEEMHRQMKQEAVSNGIGGHHPHHPQHGHQHQHQNHPHQAAIDLNPMDFIEHDPTSHPIIPSFDLDPFDMLGEFSELDQYGGPMLSAASSPTKSELLHNQHQQHQQHQQQHGHQRPGGQLISDYSPEWSWAEGDSKILVIGPWNSGQNYQVLVDGLSVPTTLIQEGVLRCICPAHEAGIVSLEVSCDGDVISDAVIFEYKSDTTHKSPPNETLGVDATNGTSNVANETSDIPSETGDFESDEDSLSLVWECGNVCNSYLCETETCRKTLRSTLLQRFQDLTTKLCEGDSRSKENENKVAPRDLLEDYLSTLCDNLCKRQWKQSADDDVSTITPTVLHLTATLNLTELSLYLLHWRESNPNPFVEKQVDVLALDEEGFTPLMRACAGGHSELSQILFKQNPKTLRMRNFYGETCLDLAGRSPNPQLVETLEALEREEGGSAAVFGAKMKAVNPDPTSPAKKTTNDFAKPTALTLSSMKFRAKSVDNTDHLLFSSSPNKTGNPAFSPRPGNPATASCDRRFKLKLLSTSPNRSSCPNQPNQPLSVNVESGQSVRRRLSKRPSLDSGINLTKTGFNDTNSLFSNHHYHHHHHHQVEAEPRKPFRNEFVKKSSEGPVLNITKVCYRETQDPGSPFIDVEGLSDEDAEPPTTSKLASSKADLANPQSLTSSHTISEREAKSSEDQKVLTLAEQFIAAMPARIKNESETEPMHLDGSSPIPFDASQSDDLGIESMADELDLEFDFSLDETYSYRETYTSSSLSPGSSCLPSPISYTMESPSPCGPRSFSACESGSPPCTTADLQEFLQASMKCERALSKLTLSDQEQRELYEAAQIIQKAYRSYKGRKKADDQQDREAKAAIVIQNYYRRYKEYLYWKQMAKAATVIQNQYRTYCEHKRFKKSQEAATCIQNYYRTYKEHKGNPRSSRESTPSTGLKRTYSQRRQHQAAKKIQQFMRKSHLKPIEESGGPSRKGICLSHRCSLRLIMAEKTGAESAAPGSQTAGRSQQLNRSISFSCCCCCCCCNSSSQNLRFLRHRSFNDFLDAAERAGSTGASTAAPCYTCTSVTNHTNTLSRKREAGSTGSGVPAKLPGFSGDPSNGSVIHHGQGAHHHLHHHHQQQHQQQAFSNGYHQHHIHHHAPPPLLPSHLRPNGSTFYGWHVPNHNSSNNNSNAQQPLHQQLPPPQVMAIVNK